MDDLPVPIVDQPTETADKNDLTEMTELNLAETANLDLTLPFTEGATSLEMSASVPQEMPAC